MKTIDQIKSIFEELYSENNDIPASSLIQYRWHSQDGYRLPALARAWRYFVSGYSMGRLDPPSIMPVRSETP